MLYNANIYKFYLEPEPQYYPDHASPNWEFNKTVFTSRADMDRLGWKRDRNEDEEDTSGNTNTIGLHFNLM